jgi:ubiquinone/menaquinone biosynthesis C-methylase UbiE
MKGKGAEYVGAVRSERLLGLYDFFPCCFLRESVFKSRLIAQASVAPGLRVLALGCGTATLTVLINSVQPQAEVVGLDCDSRILDLARGKIARRTHPSTVYSPAWCSIT